MSADWVAIKLEYVNGHATLAELADKHGVTKAAIDKRSSREGWAEARQQKSAEVSKRADEAMTDARTAELARFNEDDLRIARAIRSQVAVAIANAQKPNAVALSGRELRALASAAESAQRMGRLALGASTSNNEHSGPNQTPIAVTEIPMDEYLKARAKVLEDF